MRSGVTQYQAKRHPVAAFLFLLVFGPYVLAGILLVVAVWVVVALLCLVSGNAEFVRGKRRP